MSEINSRSMPETWRYELLKSGDQRPKGTYVEKRFDSQIALVAGAMRNYKARETLESNDIILMYTHALPTRSISPEQTIRNVVRDTAEDLGNHALERLVYNAASDIYRKYWLKLSWPSPRKILDTVGLEELKDTTYRAIEAGTPEENIFSDIGFVSLHENGDFFAGYTSPYAGTITHQKLVVPTTRTDFLVTVDLLSHNFPED